MLIAQFEIEFSYYQFLVYDGTIVLPGNDWTEDHFNQGFTRRDASVSFGTLLQFGLAYVQIFSGDYVLDAEDERAIKVPFHCTSGKVFIEGPEENVPNELIIDAGHYQLTAAQRANYEDESLFVRLYFFKVDRAVNTSEIVIEDEQLNPPLKLLETAGIAKF